jgi:hypothetical protein
MKFFVEIFLHFKEQVTKLLNEVIELLAVVVAVEVIG